MNDKIKGEQLKKYDNDILNQNDETNNNSIIAENILKIGNFTYKLDEGKSYFEIKRKDNKIINCSLECNFIEDTYNNITVSPYLEINNIKVEKNSVNELIGSLLKIDNVEDSYKREDKFYLFEFEPFSNYEIFIKEINKDRVHLKIIGNAITDGYSKPIKSEEISLDICIPIKYTNDNINVETITRKKKTVKKNTALILLTYTLFIVLASVIIFMIFLR